MANTPWVMIICKIKNPKIRNRNNRMSPDINTHTHAILGELSS